MDIGTKKEQLTLEVDSKVLELLLQTAEVKGVNIKDFIVESAICKAMRINPREVV